MDCLHFLTEITRKCFPASENRDTFSKSHMGPEQLIFWGIKLDANKWLNSPRILFHLILGMSFVQIACVAAGVQLQVNGHIIYNNYNQLNKYVHIQCCVFLGGCELTSLLTIKLIIQVFFYVTLTHIIWPYFAMLFAHFNIQITKQSEKQRQIPRCHV